MKRLALTAVLLIASPGWTFGCSEDPAAVTPTADIEPDAPDSDSDSDTAAETDASPETTDPDAALAPIVCPEANAERPDFVLFPYIQDIGQHSAWILWGTTTGLESRVEWGPTDALGEVACGQTVTAFSFLGISEPDEDQIVHETQLIGLEPATRYHYRVVTGAAVSETHHFITAPEPGAEAPLRLVAFSDSQRDDGRPDELATIVSEGIKPFIAAEAGTDDHAEQLGMILVAGDLVDNGWIPDEWIHDFFEPMRDLMQHVPLYPIFGNHEAASPFYLRNFHLPANGSAAYPEHWYWLDWSNVRIIGLDTNEGTRINSQLVWLDDVLADACSNVDIDFVFAQLHHPHKSEPWTPGNTDYTGEIIARMEAFTTACDKPSIHFFGHTHAYSRGQSRDHRHLWINVASAGGRLDRWGEQAAEDYAEFSVSEDEYGFVVVDVTAGDAPAFRMRRVSRGTPESPRDNEVSDELTVLRWDTLPDTPGALGALVGPECSGELTLLGSDFADADGESHQGSHWQLIDNCGDFALLDGDSDGLVPIVAESWRQDRNLFMGTDSQLGDDLTDEIVAGLADETSYCARVRYRSEGLGWSEWSPPSEVTTAACP